MSLDSFLLRLSRALPWLLAATAIFATITMIDLKGISTDEGFRLGIINGSKPASVDPQPPWATWSEVFATVRPHAYQPAYYFFQNTLMRLAERQDLSFFRLVNVGFFALCLLGLLVLSSGWGMWPRCFLIALFAFNAYMIMHVLQIREYPASVALYIWSTWLVLRIDRRQLVHEWPDFAWFAGYGGLIALGFYLQTWTVFPAAAQGLFLFFRRRPQFGRHAAHLALSYFVAFCLIWPYLHDNQQKVNVGLWAQEPVSLLGQLGQGFQLVLSGHLPGHARFTDALPWAWLTLLGLGLGVLLRRGPAPAVADDRRQAWLMSLCIAVPLAFQIAYFYKVEPLSVWPRYFVIHYFFLTWLIALAFRTLHRVAQPPHRNHAARLGLVAATVLLAVSAVYQVRSYRADPYFDTSLSRSSDWRRGMALMAETITPTDAILAHDYMMRATLSFVHPLTNRYLLAGELTTMDVTLIPRLLYLEPGYARSGRDALAAQLAALGFASPVEIAEQTEPGAAGVPATTWRVLAFTPR